MDYTSALPLVLQQFTLQMFFQFIFFNVFVALTLIYLRKSLTETAKREKEEKTRGDRIIEMNIKRDIIRAKAAEKKT